MEDAVHTVFPLYGYGEIRTPVLEYTEIFTHGIGNETDLVRKEMYTFEDRGGRSLTMRPEGTAGVIRALAGTDVLNGIEKRVYYIGPMFRGERPAAGRRRQFHQIGVENAGRVSPRLDAECICMLFHLLDYLGVKGADLLISTRASHEDRKPAEAVLKEYFSSRLQEMCDDCRDRFGRNVWRILDCKVEQCRNVVASCPDLLASFGSASREYLAETLSCLDAAGVKYTVDPRLVRGLDYYVHTVFEVVHPDVGAQSALAGGGRYEMHLPGLKKPVVGIGFAIGMERLLMAGVEAGTPRQKSQCTVYLAGLGRKAVEANMILAQALRRKGISSVAEVEEKSLKALLRTADRLAAKFAAIRGDDELAKNTVLLKNMADGSQKELPLEKLADELLL